MSFAINQSIAVEAHDTAHTAPNYNQEPNLAKPLRIVKVAVVRNGTVEGRPTVDIQLEDEQGEKYVTVLTGALWNMVDKFTNRGL